MHTNSKELFGIVPQVSIARGVWGGDSAGHAYVRSRHKFGYDYGSFFKLCRRICPLQPTSGFYSGSRQISKSQVLSSYSVKRNVHTNPFDAVSQNHINILQQVCNGASRLSTSLTSILVAETCTSGWCIAEELRQILNQLRSFSQSAAPPPPVRLAPSFHPCSISFSALSWTVLLPALFFSAAIPPRTRICLNQKLDLLLLSSQASSSTSLAAPISNIGSLKAGVVSATGIPTGAGEMAKAKSPNLHQSMQRSDSKDYRKPILSQSVKSTSSGFTKYVAFVVKSLIC